MTCPTQNLQPLHQGKKPHSALDAEVLLEESCRFWTEVDQLYLPYHQNSTEQTPDISTSVMEEQPVTYQSHHCLHFTKYQFYLGLTTPQTLILYTLTGREFLH